MMDFQSLAAIPALADSLPEADAEARAAAARRQDSLTKPPGSLGRLEELALFMAAWRADPRPRIGRAQAVVFAGNHGICAQGVNPYPQAVTAQMVANFEAGGASINQLCRVNGAALSVVALELDRPTADFTEGPAMTEAETLAAMACGAAAVDPGADVLVLGEMGIGNSTIAAALAAALFGGRCRTGSAPAPAPMRKGSRARSRPSSGGSRGTAGFVPCRCWRRSAGASRRRSAARCWRRAATAFR